MDFSEQFVDIKNQEELENSEGVAMLQEAEIQENLDEQKRQNGKFQSAYDGSDLSLSGPSMQDYNYEDEFNNGNSFKTDDDNGIELNNKNIKPATYEIAGHDLTTGEKFTNDYDDMEGNISSGIAELQNSKVNTKTGTPHEDMVPLTKIAKGIAMNGASYDDFLLATKGPWSDQQKATAWEGMKQAKIVQDDTKGLGNRYWNDFSQVSEKGTKEPVSFSRMEGVEFDIDEKTLVTNPVWIQSGRNFVEYFNPDGSTGMSDEEVHQFNLTTMSQFNWNIPMMMFITNEIVQSNDPE